MQDNQFYRGVLFELEKLATTNAAPSITPVAKPSAPTNSIVHTQPVANIGQPAQNVRTTPPPSPVYPKRTEAPRQFIIDPNAINDAGARNITNTIAKSNLGPQARYLAHWASTNNPADTLKQFKEVPGIIDKFQENPVAAMLNDDINKAVNSNYIASTIARNPTMLQLAPELKGQKPITLLRALQLQGGVDSQLSEDTDTTALNFSDYGGQQKVKDKAQGIKDFLSGNKTPATPTPDEGIEEAKNMLMSNDRYKSQAISGAMSEAGHQVGSFLTNNWGKIALAVGGVSALVMILKNMLGGQEQQAPQYYSRPSGPRFL